MSEFDWTHKKLNPDVRRPDFCPKCGTDMTMFGWMTTPNRHVICLKCGVEFEEHEDFDD